MVSGFSPERSLSFLSRALAFAAAAWIAASANLWSQSPLVGGAEPLDASETVPYFITDGREVPGWEIADHDLARAAFAAWSRESRGRLRFIEAESESTALIRLVWVAAGNGLFGETEHLRINGRPGAFVYVMPDVSQLGPELGARAEEDRLLRDTIVYLTCVHELGHAVGLNHTDRFDDIMYSFAYGGNLVEYFMRYRRQLGSRRDIGVLSGLSDSDQQALRALYPASGAE